MDYEQTKTIKFNIKSLSAQLANILRVIFTYLVTEPPIVALTFKSL